ncbi:hypothetical protein BC833DRAFT_9999 [Globomyces pollinis-pini]|nr:hypothetical protein BC833DRAFT_9999 [Globomyces pollinis-pini]
MLVINRYVRDATSGEMAWKSEIITDARVINAYLRHRKLIEAPAADSGDGLTIPEPCGKPRIKRRTYAHIVRLQIKQGKKPPLPDDEELSESELPKEFLKNTGVADNKAPSAGNILKF